MDEKDVKISCARSQDSPEKKNDIDNDGKHRELGSAEERHKCVIGDGFYQVISLYTKESKTRPQKAENCQE